MPIGTVESFYTVAKNIIYIYIYSRMENAEYLLSFMILKLITKIFDGVIHSEIYYFYYYCSSSVQKQILVGIGRLSNIEWIILKMKRCVRIIFECNVANANATLVHLYGCISI